MMAAAPLLLGALLGGAARSAGPPAAPGRFPVVVPVAATVPEPLLFVAAPGRTRPAQRLDPEHAVVLLDAPPDAGPLPAAVAGAAPAAPDAVVVVDRGADGIEVRVRGDLVTVYRTVDGERPCFHPVRYDGVAMTRSWPVGEDVPGEAHDHPHHRSFWFGFGDVNGHDLWSEAPGAGRVRLREVESVTSGPVWGGFVARHEWRAAGGEVLCTDRRVFRVYAADPELVLDLEVTLVADHGPVVFGDTKEGMMAWRVPATMRLEGEVGRGHIVNAAGDRDGDTWGRRAAWCDYHGPVADAVRGVAILDHPDNLRFPTWWHVRGYGLFAANPFGRRAFTGGDAESGRDKLPAGARLTFRHRVVLHRGDEEEGRVAAHALAWSRFR